MRHSLEIQDRIAIVVHRLWWLAKIAHSKNIITDSNVFVIGGRGAGRRYAARILWLMRMLELELFRLQTPVPNYSPGGVPSFSFAMKEGQKWEDVAKALTPQIVEPPLVDLHFIDDNGRTIQKLTGRVIDVRPANLQPVPAEITSYKMNLTFTKAPDK